MRNAVQTFFPQDDKLECFSELGDASKLQRFSEEKPLCTAEREKCCLFYLGLNVDMFMKVIFGGKKVSSSIEIPILSV